MGIKINFAEIEGYEPVPEGIYNVRVVSVGAKPNKAGDGTNLNWKLEITEGECADRILFLTTSLKTKALWKVKETFVGFGLDEDAEIELEFDEDEGADENGETRLIEPDMIDAVGIAHVSQTVYEGKVRNQIDKIESIDGGGSSDKAEAVDTKVTKATKPAARKFR